MEQIFELKNKLGLHARPSALFVQLTNQYKQTKIKVSVQRVNDDISEEVDGKSIMGLMMLAAEAGSKLMVKVNGEKEEELLHKIGGLIAGKFGEE